MIILDLAVVTLGMAGRRYGLGVWVVFELKLRSVRPRVVLLGPVCSFSYFLKSSQKVH
jgi:hypothetical protein